MRYHLGRWYLLTIALAIIWMIFIYEERRSTQYNRFITKHPGVKYIHYWGRQPWVSKSPFDACEHKCELSEGKFIPRNSDAVIFHSPDLFVGRPPVKPQGQIWVFHGLEPPMNYKMSFSDWYNVFNWTMSYRRDADIHHPYGTFRKRTLTQPTQTVFKPWLKKTAAWFVSNCYTQSKREEFVKMLQKYTDVDIYGWCGTLTCQQHAQKCFDLLKKMYNFYLSFESSLCRDYVTEKFFKVFQISNVIPVVRGNVHYALYGPPGSYIDSKNFTSVLRLSQYLNSVATSKQTFSTFFKFRKKYSMEFNVTSNYPLCELCRRVHKASSYQRLYNDIRKWQHGSDQVPICIRPKDLT